MSFLNSKTKKIQIIIPILFKENRAFQTIESNKIQKMASAHIILYQKVSKIKLLQRYYGMNLVFLSLIISSLYPIIMSIIGKGLSISTISFLFAFSSFLFFLPLVIKNKATHQLFDKTVLKKATLVTIIINIIYLSLYLIALNYSDPVRISVLAMSQTLFSFIIYTYIFKSEKFTIAKFVGSLLMILGATVFVGGLSSQTTIQNSFGIGELLILIASAIVPFAYQIQKEVSELCRNEVIIVLRAGISAIFFAGYMIVTSSYIELSQIDYVTILLIALTSILTFGISNIAWIEGLRYVVTSRAVSFLPLQNVFTVVFSIILLGISITINQLLGIVPLLIGSSLLLNPHGTISLVMLIYKSLLKYTIQNYNFYIFYISHPFSKKTTTQIHKLNK